MNDVVRVGGDQSASSSKSDRALVRAAGLIAGLSLERQLPVDGLHDFIKEPKNLVWVDVENATVEELSMLREVFGFHPLAIEDVSKGQQRPKVDEYKGYIFVVSYAVVSGADAHDFEVREVDLFVGPNYLVTIHRGHIPALDEALARWTRGGAMLEEGVGFLVYTVMDAIIDAYFPISDSIGDDVDQIEAGLFKGPDDALVQRFLRTKRVLHTLRRVLSPLRETFTHFLRRDHPVFSKNTQVYFQDVHDHVLRILDALDVQRDKVAGTTDAYLMMMSNRQTAQLRVLTAVLIAAVVVTLGVLVLLRMWA
jgi:magnesium transporter